MLTEDDEEIEIVPHVKGATDFEIYESVVIKPRETVLPWDENLKTSYTLKYEVSILTFFNGAKSHMYILMMLLRLR